MAAREEEFLHQEARETSRVVAKDTVFFDEVSGNETNSHLEDVVAIEKNGLGALGAVTPSNFRGNRFAIGDDGVDDATTDVLGDGTKMIAERVLSGFAGLRHKVGDVHAWSFGATRRREQFPG